MQSIWFQHGFPQTCCLKISREFSSISKTFEAKQRSEMFALEDLETIKGPEIWFSILFLVNFCGYLFLRNWHFERNPVFISVNFLFLRIFFLSNLPRRKQKQRRKNENVIPSSSCTYLYIKSKQNTLKIP